MVRSVVVLDANIVFTHGDFSEPAEDDEDAEDEHQNDAEGEGSKKQQEETVPDSALAPEIQVNLRRVAMVMSRLLKKV